MKISKGSLLSLAVLGGVLTLAAVAPALAADADWVKPVEEGVTSLSDNLVTIAGPVIGLCIGGYGVWAALKGNIEFQRIWIYLIAALFIGAGPSFATWFMSLMKG